VEPFEYRRAENPESATRAARHGQAETPHRQPAQFIAGGTNMTDYMTLNVVRPQALIDINPLAGGFGEIDSNASRLRLGALVRMAQAEDHPAIRRDYPIIQQSLGLAASRQIRNMASLGGNVLQRTRCEYFRETSWPCNRRVPASGCSALDGINREHAVLGTSDNCIATYPGDFAQALIALDAIIETLGHPSGPRRLPFAELHRLPGDAPHLETTLARGELISCIEVPAGPWTRRSCYVKVRDRKSYQFALASAAVALHLEGDTVREARIALGGVATIPWRAREAEAILNGRTFDEALARKAAAAAFAAARPRKHNAFKVPIGQETLMRALLEASAL
jgi:xanthine dehydrogenase YagS FAD-binding subunit